MADDKLEGKVKQVKGKAQETIGKITDDEEQEARGKAEQAKGKGQETVGKVKDEVKKRL